MLYIVIAVLVCICALLYHVYSNSEKDRAAFTDSTVGYSRPLGFFESLFHEMRIRLCSNTVAVMRFNSKTPISEALFTDAFQFLVKRHPFLRSTISSKLNMDMMEKYSFNFKAVNTESFDIDLEFISGDSCSDLYHSILNNSGSSGMSQDRLWRAQILKHECDEKSNCLFGEIIERNDTYDYILLFLYDHAIMDGISRMNLFAELLRFLEKTLTNQPVKMEALPIVQSCDYFLSHYYMSWFQKMFVWLTIKIFGFNQSKPEPHMSKFCPVEIQDPTTERKTLTRLIKLDDNIMSILRKKCKEKNTTIYGALTTAAAIAALDILGFPVTTQSKEPVSISVRNLVNVRGKCIPKIPSNYLGLFISFFDCEFLCIPLLDFWKLAENITKEIHQNLENIGDRIKFGSILPLIAEKIFFEPGFDKVPEISVKMNNFGNCDPIFNGIGNAVNVDYVFGGMAEHEFKSALFGNHIQTVGGHLQWWVYYHTNKLSETQVNRYIDLVQKTLHTALVE